TGNFKDNKLHTMYVDGNAESLYYVKDDTVYSGLNHQISSRIRIIMEDNKLSRITAIKSIDASVIPMDELTDDDKILDGFVWKPRDRPKSKEDIIPDAPQPKSSVLPKKKDPEATKKKPPRSEEHTSELQSRENLVCR